MPLSVKTLALCLSVALGSTALAIGTADAQDFPSKPIEVVTHASAGGGTDTTARMMLIRARRELDTDAFVNIRRGGGGAVAMGYFSEQAPDGHTLLAITPTHLFTMARGAAPITLDDLTGVVRATDDPIVIMVRADSPHETIEDLIDAGNRGEVTWGGTQVGGVDHISAMAFANRAGTQIRFVPFDGGGEIVTNLMGGNITAAGLNVTEAKDQIEAGDFRALAAMSDERLSFLPDVPTLKEKGIDVVFSTVRGYLVHKDTPAERIAFLEEKLLKALRHRTFQTYLDGNGLDASSVAGSEVWDRQVRTMYAAAEETMRDLGLIQ